MQVNNVVIVGGGSSGWMTAAALLKLCPWVNVVLVESAKHPTVGVGESTLGHFNKYLKALGLRDEDWMAECNATYKNSIQFTNFRDNNDSVFQYPFGVYDYHLDTMEIGIGGGNIEDFFDIQASIGAGEDLYESPDGFATYYNAENTLLATHNKQTDNKDGKFRNFDPAVDVAYHLDAEKFGQWLRVNVCEPWKQVDRFTHIIGDVRGMVKDVTAGGSPAQSNRIIKQLAVRLDESKKTIGVVGDLFIDCTGFKGALIEGLMNVRHISFEKVLPNNKAYFARIPYEDQKFREIAMHNTTDCEGAENGWMWTIPLWDRIGVGYCWSDRFAMPTEAKQEFEMWIERKFNIEPGTYEIKELDIKHGYREKAWELNCLAIGLSYGFVEPLESTGLLTTHENVLRLVDVLKRRKGYITNLERSWYNYQAQREVIGFSKFVAMHYALSMRTDNPYWRHATQRCDYMEENFDGNVKVNDNYERMGDILDNNCPLAANMLGMNYIAAGMGLRLGTRFSYHDMDLDTLAIKKQDREEYIAYVHNEVHKLPSHYQYLLDNIYGGVDEIRDSLEA